MGAVDEATMTCSLEVHCSHWLTPVRYRMRCPCHRQMALMFPMYFEHERAIEMREACHSAGGLPRHLSMITRLRNRAARQGNEPHK